MQDLANLRTHLTPLLAPGGRGNAPPCYCVTGSLEETPDYWIRDPRGSVVLTVKADVRLVASNRFSTPQSLRFPRVTSVRFDKRWADIFTDNELHDLVAVQDGKLQLDLGLHEAVAARRGGRGARAAAGGRGAGAARPAPGRRAVAPGLAVPALDGAVEDALFAGESVLVLLSAGDRAARDALMQLVLRHGGTATAELVALRPGGKSKTDEEEVRGRTTRIVALRWDPAAFPKQAEAAQLDSMDVLRPEWLHDCVAAGQVLPPAPRHRWRFGVGSHACAAGEVDNFGDRRVACTRLCCGACRCLQQAAR